MDARQTVAMIDRRIAARQQMVEICRGIGDAEGVRIHQRVISSMEHERMRIHDHMIAPIMITCPR